MNHVYQLVWNAARQAWVAVSEVASGVGSRGTARVRPVALGLAACWLAWGGAAAAQAIAPTTLPLGGVVAQGAATLQGAGSAAAPVLNVNQSSQRAVLNWSSFNLGSAGTVNFNQPNAQSATLNRVQDMQPSQIMGRITAPGQVTLVNPAGVYFSPSAVLDVGALTATTLHQSDADFMAGNARFSRDGATGRVVNAGSLQARDYIALLAPEVRNEGSLTVATAGTIAMAGGEAIQLHFDAFSRLASLTVSPSQIATLVENRSAVLAPGGQIILSATALRGLQASVVNSGQIDASTLTAKGGRIVLEGDHIALAAGSRASASGATGGGTVLVGGDWQGSGAMAQATTVAMDAGASIDASATHSGDGGQVVLWSDVHQASGSTTVNGRITARGVAGGGRVETSGRTVRLDTAQVDAGGLAHAGLWLIDPYDYTIGAGEAATIGASLSSGTSVTVDTSADVAGLGSSGNVGDAGNINVNASISKNAGVDATLTLRAHNDIVVASNVAIASTANRLNVVFNSDLDGSGAGAIALATGSSITSNGGNITLGGGVAGDGSGSAYGSAANRFGVQLTGATVDAGGGNVAMRGIGSTDADGVQLLTGSTISTTGTGTVTITGTGGGGVATLLDGIDLDASTISTASGAITLTGTGGVSTGTGQDGVALRGNAQVTTTGGDISITGIAGGTGNTTQNHDGVYIQGPVTVSAGGAGTLTVVGTGSSNTGGNADGVQFDGGYTLQTASGRLSVTGTSGAASAVSFGIALAAGTVQTTAGGDIDLTGTSAVLNSTGRGISLRLSGQVRATGGGNIAMTGTAGDGNDVSGVRITTGGTVSTTAGTVQILGTLAPGATGASNAVRIEGSGSVSANGPISIQGDAQGQAGAVGVNLLTSTIGTSNNNPITITTDSYTGNGTEALSAGGGTVNIRNRTAGTQINLGGADVLVGSPLTLGLTDAELARITAGTLVVGRNDATAAGAMTVSSAVAPALANNVTLQTGAALAVDAPITVNNTLTLSAAGNVGQAVGGNITATNLLLNGTGSYALATASANAVGTIAAAGAGAVSFQNSSALQIGTVDGVNGVTASGPVYLGTTNGDLTVAQSVATADAGSSAVWLNAGVASAAGTASGGNIVFSGSPAITTGSGGRTTLMTGSVAGSTGLTNFVGAGSGRFRYNSDEVTTSYTTPLGTGAYAIYREAPALALAAGSASITYGDAVPSLGSTVSGAVNGDTPASSVAVGGPQSGSLNYTAGSHSLTPSSAAAQALGYTIDTVTPGNLDVAQKTLSPTLAGVDRNYDGTTTATVNAAPGSLVGGDAVAVTYTAANFDDKHVGTGKPIAVTGLGLAGADALNYTTASTGTTSASIFPAPVTLASSTVDKPYDGTVSAPGTATVSTGTLFGGDTLSGGTFTFTDKNAGPGKTVTAAGVTVADGNGGGNYIVSYADNTNSSITPAVLTVTAPTISKTYDGTTNATGSAVVGPLAGSATGEQVGLPATVAYTDKDVGLGTKTTRAAGLTVVDSTGTDVTANYALNYVDSTVSSITPAPLTVTANADARFVTQADVAGYNGVHYDGLVGGEGPGVLGGALVVTRPGAATDVAAGSYPGALVPSGLSSGNYTIVFAPGTYTIVPASELLVRVANTSTVYGTAPTLNVSSVQYLSPDGSTLYTLSGSATGDTWRYSDGAGGSITFTPGPLGAGTSTAGKTPVGNYALGDAAPGVVGSNFDGSPVFVGNLAVTPKPVTASTSAASKTYNGSTDLQGLTLALSGQEAGDNLLANGTGAYTQKNVGTQLDYLVRDLTLAGGDARNYYLAGSNSLIGHDGSITPAAITVSTGDVVKVYDGNTSAAGAAVVVAGQLYGGDALSGGSFAFSDKNVGTGKTVTTAGVTVGDGVNLQNYTVRYADNTNSAITRLDAVTWIGGATGNWLDPSNWAGGAVPDLSNVAQVVIPDGVTVTFGPTVVPPAQGGPVQVNGIGNSQGNLAVTGGELNVGTGGITLNGLNQTGGVITNAGPTNLGGFDPLGSDTQGDRVLRQLVANAPQAIVGAGGSTAQVLGQRSLIARTDAGPGPLDTQEPHGPLVLVTPIRDATAQVTGLVQVRVSMAARRAPVYAVALPERTARVLRAVDGRAAATSPAGRPLPAWLQFDAQGLTFTAREMPANALPLTVWVRNGALLEEVEITEIP